LFGFLLLAVYYARTIIDVWDAERVAGLVWPPERVWFTCQMTWGLLWVADCFTRKNYGTLVAAGGLLGTTFFILQGVAMTGPLRE
jgi:hypothetical protein